MRGGARLQKFTSKLAGEESENAKLNSPPEKGAKTPKGDEPSRPTVRQLRGKTSEKG